MKCFRGILVRLLPAMLCVLFAFWFPACSGISGSAGPGSTLERVDPEFGGEYLLYVPTGYNKAKSWPLVVVCPSSFPYSANQMLGDWASRAETHGFLIVVPAVRGVGGVFSPKSEKQVGLQRDDETRILAAVQHVRAGYTVSEDRIFIVGRSGGAYSALAVGLRHSNRFRAIGLLDPKFDAAFLADTRNRIDSDQPVYLQYDVDDALVGDQGRQCAEWLRMQGAAVREYNFGSVSKEGPDNTLRFFQDVVRKLPWIHIEAFAESPDRPLETRFRLRGSATPARIQWDFGNGQFDVTANPTRVFAKSGTYRVTVEVEYAGSKPARRTQEFSIPAASLPNQP